MNTDVVIVGGGPVGLWTAIQIKKRNPELDVQVYERYQEYQRSHILRLEHLSVLLYAEHDHTVEEKEFFKNIMGKNFRQIFQAAVRGGHTFIRTNELEEHLEAYALALNVQINYKHIKSADELMKKHPECKIFIAADGAHSKLRADLMGEDAVTSFPLQYVVEIKYEAEGKTHALGTAAQYKANQKISGLAFEYVGREKGGKTPVTLRFFVDEETYKAVPEATFKNPLSANDPRLPAQLAQDIQTWLKVRADKAGERMQAGSDKLGKLTLSMYKAKKFALQKDGKSWFLVGDAAMGVPYFRSLNAGMMIASQLGFILTRKMISDSAKVIAYNAVQPFDTAWEFTAAMGKNMALNLYDAFAQVTGRIAKKKPAKNLRPKL